MDGTRGAATDSGPPGQHIHSGPPVCVCVCVCVRIFVTNQDIDLYNDTGMTQVLQGEGDFSGH